MTKPDLTAIALIVDRSGSMQDIASDAQGSIDSFIKEQEAQPGEVLWTVTLFDTKIDRVAFMDKATPQPRLEPRGATALYDAVGRTINEMGAAFANMPEGERPSKVIVVIITDGLENSSHEYSSRSVRALVERQTNEWSWEFIYMLAGLDLAETHRSAAAMGIAPGQTVNTARRAYGAGGQSVSYYIAEVRQGNEASLPDETIEK